MLNPSENTTSLTPVSVYNTTERINPATEETTQKLDDIINLLGIIAEKLAIPDVSARNRVNIETGTLPTVTTVGTVSAITAQHGFGSLTTNISNPLLISYYLGQICEMIENGISVENIGFDGTNFRKILTDTLGQLQVTLGTKIAGEDLTNDVMKSEEQFSYTHITTQTTTTVKSGGGLLHSLDFTATANGVITIYDNTAGSGTVIRVITSPATLLQNEVTKILNLKFAVGLTIVTATANQDIVVGWR